MAAKKDDGRKIVAENRKARYEYFITDTWEAGIELTGTEVKSLRTGQANIAESYASLEDGGLLLINALHPRVPGRRRASSSTSRAASAACCCTRARSTSSPSRSSARA